MEVPTSMASLKPVGETPENKILQNEVLNMKNTIRANYEKLHLKTKSKENKKHHGKDKIPKQKLKEKTKVRFYILLGFFFQDIRQNFCTDFFLHFFLNILLK